MFDNSPSEIGVRYLRAGLVLMVRRVKNCVTFQIVGFDEVLLNEILLLFHHRFNPMFFKKQSIS